METYSSEIYQQQQFAYADVLAAVREYALSEGYVESAWQWSHVADALKFRREHVSVYYDKDETRLKGQVKRALDALAADGTLVKAKRPGKYGASDVYACYWTPAKYAEAEAQARAQEHERSLRSARWADVWDEVVLRGASPDTSYGACRGRKVHVSLAGWETVLFGAPRGD